MSTSGIRAGKAFVEIGTKTGAFDKGIAAVQATMRRLGSVAGTIGGTMGRGFGAARGALDGLSGSVLNLKSAIVGSLAVTGLTAWVSSFADAAGAVDDMAQRTGMTAEAVSGLGYAATMSGTSIETVEASARKLSTTVAMAAAGSEEAAAKLSMIGLSAQQLARMSPDEQFLATAEALSKIPHQGQRAALAMEIFGKSGAELLPMLADGADGINALTDEAAALGIVMSSDAAASGAKLGDTMDQLMAVIGGVRNAVGAALTPMIIEFGERLITVIASVSQWVRDNSALIASIAKFAAIGAVVLGALVGIAGVAAVASAAMGGIAMAASAAGAVIATAIGAIGATIAFLASPIGIAIAAVGGLLAALIYFTGAGSTLMTYFSDTFGEVLGVVMTTVDGIKTALISGQFAAAGQLAMLGLEMAWRVGTKTLYGIWTDSLITMQNGWTDFTAFTATSAISAVATLANVFAGIPTTIMNAFSTAITYLTGAWDGTVNYIAKKLLYLYSLFDRSIDYEKAAAGMDKDFAARAKQRESELAQTTGARDKSLQDANAKRLATADGMNQSIRSDAERTKQERTTAGEDRKSQFDSRISELGEQIVAVNKEITAEAARVAAEQERKTPKTPRPNLAGLDEQPTEVLASSTKVGTFSGFAAGLGGGTSPIEKLADTNKKQLVVLSQIAENTKEQKGTVYA
jgi:hypothetical protein